jgi:hypothetical protein
MAPWGSQLVKVHPFCNKVGKIRNNLKTRVFGVFSIESNEGMCLAPMGTQVSGNIV